MVLCPIRSGEFVQFVQASLQMTGAPPPCTEPFSVVNWRPWRPCWQTREIPMQRRSRQKKSLTLEVVSEKMGRFMTVVTVRSFCYKSMLFVQFLLMLPDFVRCNLIPTQRYLFVALKLMTPYRTVVVTNLCIWLQLGVIMRSSCLDLTMPSGILRLACLGPKVWFLMQDQRSFSLKDYARQYRNPSPHKINGRQPLSALTLQLVKVLLQYGGEARAQNRHLPSFFFPSESGGCFW